MDELNSPNDFLKIKMNENYLIHTNNFMLWFTIYPLILVQINILFSSFSDLSFKNIFFVTIAQKTVIY